jgi:hypothetical protein
MSEDTKMKKAPRRNRRRIAMFLGLGLLLLAFWVVGGYSINLPSSVLLNQLNAKRELWKSHGIDDYRLAIQRGYVLWITVEDGQVAKLEEDSRQLGWDQLYTYDPAFVTPATHLTIAWEMVPIPYKTMTIDNLFEYLEDAWTSDGEMPLLSTCWNIDWTRWRAVYTFEFDDQYGYIKNMFGNWNPHWQYGSGELCPYPTLLDAFTYFTVIGFEPINIAD